MPEMEKGMGKKYNCPVQVEKKWVARTRSSRSDDVGWDGRSFRGRGLIHKAGQAVQFGRGEGTVRKKDKESGKPGEVSILLFVIAAG